MTNLSVWQATNARAGDYSPEVFNYIVRTKPVEGDAVRLHRFALENLGDHYGAARLFLLAERFTYYNTLLVVQCVEDGSIVTFNSDQIITGDKTYYLVHKNFGKAACIRLFAVEDNRLIERTFLLVNIATAHTDTMKNYRGSVVEDRKTKTKWFKATQYNEYTGEMEPIFYDGYFTLVTRMLNLHDTFGNRATVLSMPGYY